MPIHGLYVVACILTLDAFEVHGLHDLIWSRLLTGGLGPPETHLIKRRLKKLLSQTRVNPILSNTDTHAHAHTHMHTCTCMHAHAHAHAHKTLRQSTWKKQAVSWDQEHRIKGS